MALFKPALSAMSREQLSRVTSAYYINDGKIVTGAAGTPIEITTKLGDRYYGGTQQRFGYAATRSYRTFELILPGPEGQEAVGKQNELPADATDKHQMGLFYARSYDDRGIPPPSASTSLASAQKAIHYPKAYFVKPLL